jgi:NADH:ubiquinone oxidoreductase subunit 5 (subunit L)/multisubunit Na+/H+ antiporter MnhA subunit
MQLEFHCLVYALAAQPLVGLLLVPVSKASPKATGVMAALSSLAPLLLTPFIPDYRDELFLFDNLSKAFAIVISLIGFLCMLYSYEYMIHDDAQGRYYFWMLTFLASMLLLVTANSPLVLLLAWELTGLCSFSLIAHWNFKRSALSGAYKALVITELGSGFLLLGLVLANVHELSGAPSAVPLAAQLLVLIGALAKSAQYPLLLWLPDAMEAPTPVSAYLHAAAMVKAGFYILLRLYGMIEQILPLALLLGCISTLAGGLLMLFARDIKRILAYSTISHLGLLFSAVSVGGILPALLHFLNHAVAKALLFLSAGAVEHETGKRSLDELGGLVSQMPLTAAVFTLGALSLSGVPPLGGFVSKWLILWAALQAGSWGWLLVATLLVSSVLTFMGLMRVAGGVFYSNPVEGVRARDPHPTMLLPLLLLAAGTVLLGALAGPTTAWLQSIAPWSWEVGTLGTLALALSLVVVSASAAVYIAAAGRVRTTLYLCGEGMDPEIARVSGVPLYADLQRSVVALQLLLDPDRWLPRFCAFVLSGLEKLASRGYVRLAMLALSLMLLILAVVGVVLHA